MQLTFATHASTVVATLSGRLDSTTSPDAQQQLLEQIGRNGQNALLLDLSGLDYLSSAGLRVLLAAVKATGSASSRTAVVTQRPHIREILQISGFSSLVPTYESVEEAVKALNG